MKFWTIQTDDVIDIIKKNNSYHPEISKGFYSKNNQEMINTFGIIRQSFNKINHTDILGIVFAFTEYDDNGNIVEIPDIDSFLQLMRSKRDVIGPLWNSFIERGGKILELETDFDQNMNLLYIDINDFQLIMPPILPIPPLYNSKYVQNVLNNLIDGIWKPAEILRTGIAQAHLPSIELSQITAIHKLSSL